MSEPSKHIQVKQESSTYEKILIHPIEKDKKNQQEADLQQSSNTLVRTFSALSTYFKKFTSLFSSTRAHSSRASTLQNLLHDIFEFRKLLVTLAGEDTSHLPEFGETLSVSWDQLLDHCNHSPSSSDPVYPLFAKLLFFKNQVQHFPIGAEHTLGYYLSHHVGKGWIPFPFMDLLQNLHEEFSSSPTTSTLQKWILLLDEILIQKNLIE